MGHFGQSHPHQFLEAYVMDELLGRRVAVLGEWKDDVVLPLALGLSDQLSVYTDCRSGARLSLRGVQIREGHMRTYLLAGLRDRGHALDLRNAFRAWQPPMESSRPEDFVGMHIARRWRFIERHRGLLERLFTRIAEVMVVYRQRCPTARPKGRAGIIRLHDGVDETTVSLELDNRSVEGPQDQPNRYLVQ